MNPETKLKKKVLDQLRTIPNSYWFKTQEKSLRGIPDIVGLIQGHFVALELKSSDKFAPSPLQKQILDYMLKAGGTVYTVNPQNWDTIFPHLASYKRE